MKEYPTRAENTRTDTNRTTFLQPSKQPVQPSAKAQAVFSTVGSFNTHVLQSILLDRHEDFLARCFKEWEQWEIDYNSRAFQRRQCPPFTPTDWPTP